MNAKAGTAPLLIVAKNSTAYIAEVFACLNRGGTFASVSAQTSPEILARLGTDEQLEPNEESGWYDGPPYEPRKSDEIGQIAFSSGTEGKPRAIQVTHAALANTTQRLLEVMEINEEIREYVGIPVYHSFGFGRCRTVSAAGGRFYLPANGFDPLEIQSLLKEGAINAISAVPSLWRIVLDSAELFEDVGGAVRWIEIGSQYMSAEEKVALKKLFPNANIVQHYGLTEASRSTFLKIHECPEEFLESVGQPLYGVEVRIDGEGAIQIKGPHLSRSVLSESGETPIVDDEGWLTTSDIGRLAEGYLHFGGRKDDLINCGGVKLVPDLVELKLKKETGIHSGFAVFGGRDSLRGEVPVLALEEELESAEVERLEQALIVHLEKMHVKIGARPQTLRLAKLPTTSTGKIRRKQLVQDFQTWTQPDRPEATTAEESPQDELTEKIAKLWSSVLGIQSIKLSDSFFDLGGDSLSAIRVSLAMEKAGIQRDISRKIFQGLSIEQLVQHARHAAPDDELTEKISNLWRSVLGIESVQTTDSFFDLGGDSLSAIRVSLSMEKAGIPRDVSRKIFQGLSIQELVRHAQSSTAGSAASSGETSFGTPLAMGAQSLNIIRGLLVIANVASHWMLGVVERLPPIFETLNQYLAVFYSSGTPGFAVIFGAGIGYYIYPRFTKSPESIRSLALRNAGILAFGIALLAAVASLNLTLNNSAATSLDYSNSFWSVLTYYFWACLSIPLWMRMLREGHLSFFSKSLLYAGLFYGIHQVIARVGIAPSPNPVVQPFVLLLTAKYNYFEMSAGVLLGAGFGDLLRTRVQSGEKVHAFSLIGLVAIGLSVFVSVEAGDGHLWMTWPKRMSIWLWLFYFGASLFAVSSVYRLYSDDRIRGVWRPIGNLLAVMGVMAFPLFIAHEVVLPLKSVLTTLQVPAALPLSLLLYFVTATFLIVKLYRVYFGSGQSGNQVLADETAV